MKITIDIPDVKKICPFCGIEFDQRMLDELSREDRPHNSSLCSRIEVNKTCSLACCWLRDPNMYGILSEPHCNGRDLIYWQEVVAKRIAKAVTQARKEEKIATMKGTVLYMVLEKLGDILP